MPPYTRLGINLIISFIIMYSVMFLNADKFDHVYLSWTRTYMSMLMVLPMAVVMILLMPKMFPDKVKNGFIIGGSSLAFVLVLFLMRTQVPIGDEQYMKAMIPHHSSAILTSQEAHLEDPEVKKLAEEIIAAQKKEIAQMKAILNRMEQ